MKSTTHTFSTKAILLGILALVFLLPQSVRAAETLCYTQRITDASSFGIYTGKDNPNNPITWTHTVPAGILDRVVRVGLYIEAWDVDYPPDGDEYDRVYFNGHDLGYLQGSNDTWHTVEKTVPVAAIKEGINELKVYVDELGKSWKVTIRASELRFYCSSADPDFSIGTTLASNTIKQGESSVHTVTLIGLNSFESPVNLSVTGLPTGATAAFSANPATPSPTAESTLTISTTVSVLPGSYSLTINGEGGGKSHSTSITLKIDALPVQTDFTLTTAPSLKSITAGESTKYDITVNPKNGFNENVTLAVKGLPTGVTGTFSPNPMPVTGTAGLNIATTTEAAPGTYTLTIEGTADGKTRTADVALEIKETAQTPDFSIAAEPDTQTIHQGETADYKIKLESINGFAFPVELSIDGLPTGASAAFNPIRLRPTGNSELKITTTENVPTGKYKLTITARTGKAGGSLKRTAKLTLFIEEKPEDPDFEIKVQPYSQTLHRGETTDYTITITPLNGFEEELKLELTGLPAGTDATFDTETVTPVPSGTVKLNVATTGDTPTGMYSMTVNARGSELEHSVQLQLKVECRDFNLKLEADTVNGPAPLTVNFRAIASGNDEYTSADYKYTWNFGDGNTATTQEVEHTYQTPGNYTAAVTVTDPCGKTKTATKKIEAEGFEGAISKSFSVSEAHPGQELYITIQARNETRFDFDTVVIRDTLAPQLQYVEDDAPVTPQRSGQQLEWRLPGLKTGETAAFNIKVKVSDNAATGTVTNIAYMAHDSMGAGNALASNTATLKIQKMDVTLIKGVEETNVEPGETIKYQLTLKNKSSVALTGIQLTDELPDQLEYQSQTQNGNLQFYQQGRKLRWTGTMDAGQQVVIIFKARLKPDVFSGTRIENTAKLEAVGLPAPLLSNTVETTVTSEPVATTQVRFTKRSEVPQTEIGRVIRFNITIANQSQSVLVAPVIEDHLPQGFEYVANSTLLNNQQFTNPQGTRRLLWQLPHINPMQTVVLRYQVVIGADTRRGRNTNRAVLRTTDSSGQQLNREASAFVNVSTVGIVFYSGVDGTVYLDRDNDEFYSMNDTPLEGIEVRMSNGQKTFTDQLGRFKFENLFPGEYAVSVNRATLPEKLQAQSPVPKVVTLADGLHDTVEFGIRFKADNPEKNTRLEGWVFFDKNNNKKRDNNEKLAENSEILLNGKIKIKAKSGRFVFTKLTPGNHSLEVRCQGETIHMNPNLKAGNNTIEIPIEVTGIRVIVGGRK
jgi:uncharacterized repeat protein (TIGR01451 family)